MIKIICGVYGGVDGMKRPGDKPFSLPPAEEARLVARKVAVYVNEPATEAPQDEDEQPESNHEQQDEDDGTPIGFDEMPPEDFTEDDEDEAEVMDEIIDLETLTGKELREMGAEYGLTFKANAKKADMIAAITAAQIKLAEDVGDAPTFDASEAVEE